MSDWSNFSALLTHACQQAFGETVLYRPEAGDPVVVTGLVTRASEEEQQKDGVYLQLALAIADLASPPVRGDRVTIQDVHYMVWQSLVDEAGGYKLGLRRA
jgi:hypothetical protein